jgi:hypothetical protein
MRRWSSRTPSPPPEPPHDITARDDDDDETPPTLWSIEQLKALRPVTGPGHRTIVPTVRNTLRDNTFGDLADS